MIGSPPGPDDDVKEKREDNPNPASPDGAAQIDGAAVAKKINAQSRENSKMKCDPKPDADRHAALGFHV